MSRGIFYLWHVSTLDLHKLKLSCPVVENHSGITGVNTCQIFKDTPEMATIDSGSVVLISG